jgi:hypothetical protein
MDSGGDVESKVYLGSLTYSLPELAEAMETARELASLARKLEAAGFAIETVDLGGGIGIGADALTPESYAEAVLPALDGLSARILIEPGRAIAGPAGVLLTRVLGVKREREKIFVIVDAAMIDLRDRSRPAAPRSGRRRQAGLRADCFSTRGSRNRRRASSSSGHRRLRRDIVQLPSRPGRRGLVENGARRSIRRRDLRRWRASAGVRGAVVVVTAATANRRLLRRQYRATANPKVFLVSRPRWIRCPRNRVDPAESSAGDPVHSSPRPGDDRARNLGPAKPQRAADRQFDRSGLNCAPDSGCSSVRRRIGCRGSNPPLTPIASFFAPVASDGVGLGAKVAFNRAGRFLKTWPIA